MWVLSQMCLEIQPNHQQKVTKTFLLLEWQCLVKSWPPTWKHYPCYLQNNMHLSWTQVAIWLTQSKLDEKLLFKDQCIWMWTLILGIPASASKVLTERRSEHPLLQRKSNGNCRHVKVLQIRKWEPLSLKHCTSLQSIHVKQVLLQSLQS